MRINKQELLAILKYDGKTDLDAVDEVCIHLTEEEAGYTNLRNIMIAMLESPNNCIDE